MKITNSSHRTKPAPTGAKSWLGIIGCLLWATQAGLGADQAATAAARVPSVQEQLDQLREGQQQLMQEVQELKAMLAERESPRRRGSFPVKPPPPETIRLNVYEELFRGSTNARVAIVEYSDFDCSHCAKFATEIYPQLERDYLKSGRIRYYFHDLPAPKSPESQLKARVARCASEQGKFWEMHDELYAAQSRLPAEQEPSVLAKALHLDLEKFNLCISSTRYVEVLERVTAEAALMGIPGTPAFLIGTVSEDGNFFQNFKLQLGAEKYEDLKAPLEAVLALPPGN